MFRLFECCALSFFERFVLSFSLKIERFVSDSAEIWICGLYLKINQNLRYYLYLSVRNAAINALQKNNMLSMEELSGIDMGIPEESIDEEEQEERNKLLLEKLQKLPHQELQVVRAVIMENKKYKEAAEELHISVNTLKTHLTRALKQLRKEYNLHSLFY